MKTLRQSAVHRLEQGSTQEYCNHPTDSPGQNQTIWNLFGTIWNVDVGKLSCFIKLQYRRNGWTICSEVNWGLRCLPGYIYIHLLQHQPGFKCRVAPKWWRKWPHPADPQQGLRSLGSIAPVPAVSVSKNARCKSSRHSGQRRPQWSQRSKQSSLSRATDMATTL